MAIPKHIWSGVYRSFAEVPKGDVFNSERWINRLADTTPQPEKGDFPGSVVSYDYILPVVCALASQGEPVSILDFGGGLGNIVGLVDSMLPDPSNLRFHIVEMPSICAQGAKRFKNDRRVSFHEVLPQLDSVTVVHVASALHYIEDWKGLLSKLADYRPQNLIFTDLPAGDIETFVTSQYYYGDLIPVRFWNFKEFCRAVENLGFKLSFASRYGKTYLTQTGELPTDNFPANHRLRWACQLMFSAR